MGKRYATCCGDTPGETSMLLRVNQGGTISLEQVFVGVNDSGDAGFAVLQVADV